MSSRLAWLTEQVVGQPGLHRKTLSQKNKKDKNVSLFINHIKINKLQFEYSLTEKECYYLKNTILYLINDYTDTSNIEIYINLN